MLCFEQFGLMAYLLYARGVRRLSSRLVSFLPCHASTMFKVGVVTEPSASLATKYRQVFAQEFWVWVVY
jgi:hypothetical protein